MSRSIVFLTGSPSPSSRSALVARAVASETQRAGLQPTFWSLADFDAADVLFARVAAPGVVRFVDAVKQAAGLVLATPVYKGVYTGALKAIVDLVPPDALVDKPALGIATARQAGHGVSVDHAYRALFAFFRVRALDTLFLVDDDVTMGPEGGALSAGGEPRAHASARDLVQAVRDVAPAVSRP
jgi:FMN reductase